MSVVLADGVGFDGVVLGLGRLNVPSPFVFADLGPLPLQFSARSATREGWRARAIGVSLSGLLFFPERSSTRSCIPPVRQPRRLSPCLGPISSIRLPSA